MRTAARALALTMAVSAAGLLLWLSVVSNLARGCTVADTPYLTLCPDADAAGPQERSTGLRRHIERNPGDSGSYVELLALQQHGPQRLATLRAASTVAPNDPNVLRARATLALEQGRMTEAALGLVQLTEHYHYLAPQPAVVLARMIAGRQQALLQEHLKPGTRWFPIVLEQMIALKLPLANALPMVSIASAKAILPAPAIRAFVRSLKAEGSWADAYGLWVGQHGGRVPVLYNAGFDQPFELDGFDWEVASVAASRAGATAQVSPHAGRGNVLDVVFTGRAMAVPLVRQYLFLAPTRYRLEGQYMAARLRSEGGVAWTVSCPSLGHKLPVGQTAALADTQGVWKAFQMEFTVPSDCGPVTSLQLEPALPYEAAVGMRGTVYFDAFSLIKLGS